MSLRLLVAAHRATELQNVRGALCEHRNSHGVTRACFAAGKGKSLTLPSFSPGGAKRHKDEVTTGPLVAVNASGCKVDRRLECVALFVQFLRTAASKPGFVALVAGAVVAAGSQGPARAADVQASVPDNIQPTVLAAVPSVKAILNSDLLDYQSARFKDVTAFMVTDRRGNVVTTFCGEVNAKNRFGGYTGWTGFYVHVHADEPGRDDSHFSEVVGSTGQDFGCPAPNSTSDYLSKLIAWSS